MIKGFGCFYWFLKTNDHTDKMITEFNNILTGKDDDDPFDVNIKQIDLQKLKGNLINFFDNNFTATMN